ncbi:aminotransferase class III-fold pyridoxal phosphate-dependent enzyme [Arsenicicoccus sp. oral taxon 190]|uniref:aminotransferase class III-fold pyridoxal phosphate-dependent enzyme n=1 Tax=Arsenicicoccus sp. oral taxon 190 TaxID=1658671 RepID=UPI000A3DB026
MNGVQESLLAWDRRHLWHPYSTFPAAADPYLVRSARGVRLRLEVDGRPREVVDAMSSWWCAVHGYAVPELDAAVRDQLGAMSHVMFGGLTHEPAVTLGRRLVALAPSGQADESPLQHAFLADSGSVAVEVALKMAWQYHVALGRPRRRMFTIRGGYHGDTVAPMSVCDPVSGMHTLFTGVLPEQVFAPRPPAGLDLDGSDPAMAAWERETRALYAEHAAEIAAVVVEPVLQGAGGMHVYSPYAVRVLASLAAGSGALLVADEIATGLGRTGTLWAVDRCGVVPDILCVGKALTGGYLTLAATLCTTSRCAWPRSPGPRSTEGCGCGPSATSSTRCRPTPAPTTTWPPSPARWSRPSPSPTPERLDP